MIGFVVDARRRTGPEVEGSSGRHGSRSSVPAAGGPPARPPGPEFAVLVREHLDRLYGYCRRLARDRSEAEDIVQETLLRAMRRYGGLRDPEHAKAWLFAIATNVWRDRARARGRELETLSLDTASADDDFSLFQTLAIEDPLPYSDELHLDFLRLFRDEDVQSVFGAMNPLFRVPLILTVVHGFSCKEAAAILDIPLGTLLSRLHRGRKQLERGLWDYAIRNGLVRTADEEAP